MRKLLNSLFEQTTPKPAGRQMTRACQLLATLITGVLLVGGCTKKTPEAVAPAPVTEATNAAPTPAGPTPAPPAPVQAVAPAPDGGADLKELNRAYIGWIIRSGKHAKTFEEFAAASGVKVPPPPAGKKYVIDKHGYVALASQ